MPKGPKPKITKAMIEFICDKIEEGMTIREICKKFHGHPMVAEEKTLYLWRKKYPEFKQRWNESYQTWVYRKLDEMEELTTSYKELEQNIQSAANADDTAEFRRQLAMSKDKRDNAKMRLTALQFMLGKIAPKLVPELTNQNQTINTPPQITIINYSDRKQIPE